ncbi:MAG: YciI family protein [Rhodomicrobium sp.]
MYAVVLRYKLPIADVDRHIEGHRHWLRENYAAGNFLLSGPQRPRTGGFILAAAMERTQLDGILRSDPFSQNGIAEYEVIDVAPVNADDRLSFLIEKP